MVKYSSLSHVEIYLSPVCFSVLGVKWAGVHTSPLFPPFWVKVRWWRSKGVWERQSKKLVNGCVDFSYQYHQTCRRAQLPHASFLISGIIGAPGCLLIESNSNYRNWLVPCIPGFPRLHSLMGELGCSLRFIVPQAVLLLECTLSPQAGVVRGAAHLLPYVLCRSLQTRSPLLIKWLGLYQVCASTTVVGAGHASVNGFSWHLQ